MGSKPHRNRPATLDHLRSQKKPVTRRYPIVLDEERAEEFHDARMALERAQAISERAQARLKDASAALEEGGEPPRKLVDDAAEAAETVETAQQEFDRLRAEMDEFVVDLVFRSIGRKPYERLLDSCPPDPKEVEAAKKAKEQPPGYDSEAFIPALIAASCVEPVMTVEDVEALAESEGFNVAEMTGMFMTALEVNTARRVVDLSKD